eukprot:scaffold3664_cov407-Prasinococcus_capsulatus_cf.AAC.5
MQAVRLCRNRTTCPGSGYVRDSSWACVQSVGVRRAVWVSVVNSFLEPPIRGSTGVVRIASPAGPAAPGSASRSWRTWGFEHTLVCGRTRIARVIQELPPELSRLRHLLVTISAKRYVLVQTRVPLSLQVLFGECAGDVLKLPCVAGLNNLREMMV